MFNTIFTVVFNYWLELLFKEKVVEKTIAFTPNIAHIYKKTVSSYNDKVFDTYMCEKAIKLISEENALYLKSELYRKNISNIRILKFAIEHFYSVFSYYAKLSIVR